MRWNLLDCILWASGSYKKFLSMWMTYLDFCIRKIKSDSKEGDKSQGEHVEGSYNSQGKMADMTTNMLPEQ